MTPAAPEKTRVRPPQSPPTQIARPTERPALRPTDRRLPVSKPKSLKSQLTRWRWVTFSMVIGLAVAGSARLFWRFQGLPHLQNFTLPSLPGAPATAPTPAVSAPVRAPAPVRPIVSLGRLVPKGEVIRLSAPTSAQENRIERLLIDEGDRVQAGQVVAILDAQSRLQADLAEAQAQVDIARSKLAVVQAGAKQGELLAQESEIARLKADWEGNIAAQEAKIARLQAELANAQTDYERNQALFQEGAISASQRDSSRLVRDVAQRSLEEAQRTLTGSRATLVQELNKARSNLARIAEVRPVDVRAAQAEVSRALAALRQAQARLSQTQVRSPVGGEVLDIYTRPGEVVGTNGIAEIGQTQEMRVIAEIYQSDVHRVQVGQQVRITSDSLPKSLTGTVALIGSQVRRQTIINTDPTSNIDARVVEVWLNLSPESSRLAAKMTNLQVKVTIQP
jgi:HlyD family secretion protein